MNIHVEAPAVPVDVAAHALAMVPPGGWRFLVGERVDHVNGGFPATVVDMTCGVKASGEFAQEIVVIRLDTAPDAESGDVLMIQAEALRLAS